MLYYLVKIGIGIVYSYRDQSAHICQDAEVGKETNLNVHCNLGVSDLSIPPMKYINFLCYTSPARHPDKERAATC